MSIFINNLPKYIHVAMTKHKEKQNMLLELGHVWIFAWKIT